MTKILILGTSEIGYAVQRVYAQQGANAVVAGRNGGQFRWDLTDRSTWNIWQHAEWDEVHFTVHDPRAGLDQVSAMYDFLATFMPRPVRAIVYSSEWGSIGLNTIRRLGMPHYKMAKAALNMAVNCLAQRHDMPARWLLIHPGAFASRMNPRGGPHVIECAERIVGYMQHWDSQFRWVDVADGQEIPW